MQEQKRKKVEFNLVFSQVYEVCDKPGADGVRFRIPKLVLSCNSHRFDFGFCFLVLPAFLC